MLDNEDETCDGMARMHADPSTPQPPPSAPGDKTGGRPRAEGAAVGDDGAGVAGTVAGKEKEGSARKQHQKEGSACQQHRALRQVPLALFL